jgi:hypothetical protein
VFKEVLLEAALFVPAVAAVRYNRIILSWQKINIIAVHYHL